MKKRCLFVTVDGTSAGLSTWVQSAHRSLDAARRAARRANRGGARREVVSADLMSLMQAGLSYTDACVALAGKEVQPATVEYQR